MPHLDFGVSGDDVQALRRRWMRMKCHLESLKRQTIIHEESLCYSCEGQLFMSNGIW